MVNTTLSPHHHKNVSFIATSMYMTIFYYNKCDMGMQMYKNIEDTKWTLEVSHMSNFGEQMLSEKITHWTKNIVILSE